MQLNTAQCSSKQFKTALTAQCSLIQLNASQCSSIEFNAVKCGSIQLNAVQNFGSYPCTTEVLELPLTNGSFGATRLPLRNRSFGATLSSIPVGALQLSSLK